MLTSQRIKRFFEFSGSDRVALLLFGVRVPFYKLALTLFGYERFQRFFIASHQSDKTPNTIELAKHYGKLINKAVRATAGDDNCLLRSVMLARYLAKRGYAPKIIFGMGKDGASFQAHSWVELDGLPVNDRDNIAQSHAIFEALIK